MVVVPWVPVQLRVPVLLHCLFAMHRWICALEVGLVLLCQVEMEVLPLPSARDCILVLPRAAADASVGHLWRWLPFLLGLALAVVLLPWPELLVLPLVVPSVKLNLMIQVTSWVQFVLTSEFDPWFLRALPELVVAPWAVLEYSVPLVECLAVLA
jgi:hypothetical protein